MFRELKQLWDTFTCVFVKQIQSNPILKPILGPPKKFKYLTRAEEVVITRLRIGHTKATKSHILSPGPPTACQHCDQTLTIEHMLVECTVLQQIRDKYYMADSLRTLFETIPETCIVEFLREAGFFYLIWKAIYPAQHIIRITHQLTKFRININHHILTPLDSCNLFIEHKQLRKPYSWKTANMSLRMCVIVKQMQSNPVHSLRQGLSEICAEEAALQIQAESMLTLWCKEERRADICHSQQRAWLCLNTWTAKFICTYRGHQPSWPHEPQSYSQWGERNIARNHQHTSQGQGIPATEVGWLWKETKQPREVQGSWCPPWHLHKWCPNQHSISCGKHPQPKQHNFCGKCPQPNPCGWCPQPSHCGRCPHTPCLNSQYGLTDREWKHTMPKCKCVSITIT